MAQVTMKREQYQALVRWAKDGVPLPEQLDFYKLRKEVDFTNGVVRYPLVVRCTVLPNQAGPTYVPASLNTYGEFDRKPTKEDALSMIAHLRYQEGTVQVTSDPGGLLGFYEIDRFPWG